MSTWGRDPRLAEDLDPMAQAEVEDEILRLSRRLTEVTEDVAANAMAAARAEAAYDLAKARAMLNQVGEKGTVPEKQARALIAAADELIEAKSTEAIYQGDREAGRNLRAQLDALRTIAANVRDRVAHATGRGG